MRKFTVALVAAFMAVFAVGGPAGAITYGELDDGEHPYVGFIIYFDPAEDAWFSCSGTLLDANTFLTAGHCAYGIGTEGEAVEDAEGEVITTGGTDVWATFDDSEVLDGWPARTDYPNTELLYDARRAWLEDPENGFIQGTAYPHPEYDNFSGFPVTYDVGVVELDAAAPVMEFGELAPLDTVETLVADADNPNDAIVENVGYGIQSVQPHPMDVATRYKSTSRIVETKGNRAESGNLHTLNNPSAVGGRGGTCFGDSGGPVLVNDTNQVIAVVSFGDSLTCHGADYSWRVDTVDSYNFILPFLS